MEGALRQLNKEFPPNALILKCSLARRKAVFLKSYIYDFIILYNMIDGLLLTAMSLIHSLLKLCLESLRFQTVFARWHFYGVTLNFLGAVGLRNLTWL